MTKMLIEGVRILSDLRLFFQVVVVVVGTLHWCETASAQMILYDNFDASVIDPAKWVGAEGYDPDIREALRQIAAVPGVPKDKRLHLMQRVYSATTDNSGSSGGLFGLSFPNPSTVTAVSFTLVVNKIAAVACSTNPGIGVTTAEFRGSFFNTDSVPTNGDHDVIADIDIERSVQENSPTVVGFVGEGNGTILGYQVLGTVVLGSTNTLSLKWDEPNHQFVFQLNSGAQVVEPYSVTDTSPPFYAFKNIDLARVVPHCTSTRRPYALVDANFDDVYVNQ